MIARASKEQKERILKNMKLAKLILLFLFLSFLSGNLSATVSVPPQTNKTAEGNFVSEIHLETDTNSLLAVLNDDSNGLLNICLPNISYDNYNNRVFGFYDYYGRGGFLSAVVNDNGTLSYVYSGPFGANGNIVYLQFNESSGQWDSFNTPSPDCLSCDLNRLFAALWSSDVGHFILDIAGMFPVVGEAFDVLNGVWYLIEEDGVNASLSFASTIPLVYATTIKNVGRVIKLQDGTFAAIKLSSKATETLIATLKNLNLSDDALKRLFKDLQNTDFAKALAENPSLVEAWKVLDDAGVDGLLRKDVLEIEFVNKNLDKINTSGGYNEWISKTLKGGDDFFERIDDVTGLVTDLNKKYSNGVQLTPEKLESAINSASYYSKVSEQGTAVFNSLVKGHIFENGVKRTASDFITKFAKGNGLTLKLDSQGLQNLTTELATGTVYEIDELAKLLF